LIGAIGVLSAFDISSAKILPVTSAKPPAGKATTISIGLDGYFSWDQDRVGAELRAIACPKTSAARMFFCNRFINASFEINSHVPNSDLQLFPSHQLFGPHPFQETGLQSEKSRLRHPEP
jgi:hypothetical protein